MLTNISPSSGRAPPGALRLSYPPRVDFLLPSLTIWPPEQDPEYETHTLVVRRAKSVLIHLSPDETFDVALAGWCLSCATGAPPSPRVWLPLPRQLLRDQPVLLPVCVRETLRVWLKRVQSLQILSPSKVFPKKEIKHVYPKRFACAPPCQLLFLHLERLLPSRLSYFSSLPSSQHVSSTFPPALCDLLLTSLILSLWPMFHLICI